MSLKKVHQKDEVRSKILRQNNFGFKSRWLILLDIEDIEIREFLLDAAKYLDIVLLISSWKDEEKFDYIGFDAFISDGISWNLDIVSLVQSGVVPIIPLNNAFPRVFSEFDPMKFEGNAFLYNSLNKYLILEKLIRYMENIRYAGDKRTLLNNLWKTF